VYSTMLPTMEVNWLMVVLVVPTMVDSTSVKMDFLSAGVVRTDPLMYSEIGECLSDHVHRYYGAVSDQTMRPEVTYDDLRNADGNSGNVEENLSLYWNPAIYKVKNQNNEDKTYELVDVWFASAYYVWRTGETTAFPPGLKMRTTGADRVARAVATCDGVFTCERWMDETEEDGCEGYEPSNQAEHGFLPVTGCGELELNIKFPTCWDGVNVEDVEGKHMVFSEECYEYESNECFDFECPSSHPVRLPEIHLYVRILEYEGGAHVFANDTDIFHSDYFSGWDEEELQYLLDECENYSEAAMPDAFCSEYLTFRGHGKEDGVQYEDEDIVAELKTFQPDPVDTQGTISPEDITGIPELQRGECTGTLIKH